MSLNDLTCFQRDRDKFDECLFIEQRDLETVELLSQLSVVIVHLLKPVLNGPSDLLLSALFSCEEQNEMVFYT